MEVSESVPDPYKEQLANSGAICVPADHHQHHHHYDLQFSTWDPQLHPYLLEPITQSLKNQESRAALKKYIGRFVIIHKCVPAPKSMIGEWCLP